MLAKTIMIYFFPPLLKEIYLVGLKIVASTKFLDQDEDSLKTRDLVPSLKLFQNTWKKYTTIFLGIFPGATYSEKVTLLNIA